MRNSGVENKFYIVQGDIKDLYKTIKDLYKTAHMQWLPDMGKCIRTSRKWKR
jgi:hypothetical protein